MNNEKIGFGEALCILIIITLSHLILTLPKTIIESQGSSSILNVLYVSIIALIIVFVITKLYKNFKGKDILDISEFLFGKFFKFIFGLLFIAYFIFVASLLVRNTSENLKSMYFNNAPIPFIALFLLFAAGFINKLGLKAVIKCNLIIVPAIIIILGLLFLVSSNNLVFERVFPILGYGAQNTFVNGSSNVYAFSSIAFLFLIMPILKDYNEFNKISFSYIGIASLFIIATISSLLLTFPIEVASGSNVPIYILIREITFGNFIQRTDAFFVIIWILTTLSYLSIMIAFILLIFKKITNIQNKSAISNCLLAILFGTSLIYSNILQIRFLQSIVYKNFVLIFIFGINIAILILSNIKQMILKRKKVDANIE